MNGEVENTNENKKKQKVLVLVGLVTLLIAVLGATYAYFQISTDTESSNTNITGSTPANGLVTLIPGTDNLHLNISASDMSQANSTKEYYGTDGEDPYVGTEELGTKTIASVELTGGEETTKYSCTAKLTVSKVTEEDPDTMIEVLQPGDMILQFKGNIIGNKLDLSDLKTTGSKEYNLKFNISGNTPEEIQAYIKLVNKEEQQNYLAGHKLNIDINTSDLKCNVAIVDTTVAQLRYEDTKGYLSEDLQGGMYRYQAAPADENEVAKMTNWICFGTTEKSECTNPETGIDKYMYRIIGITDEGQMYLIKETFLKEGEINEFVWNSSYLISDCLGETCEWPNVKLYKRLNGTSNGDIPGSGDYFTSLGANTDIFVDSIQYDYLKSGDTNSGGEASDWYNLIEDHNWMYGDTNEYNTANSYNGDYMYSIETGKTSTKKIWPDEVTQTTCSDDNTCAEKDYTWSKSVNAKIGLMYMHDVDYAYTEGNPGSNTNVKNSWIYFQKDGYNTTSSWEWLITRWGVYTTSYSGVIARVVDNFGNLIHADLTRAYGIRPVFYLSSKAKIIDGDGTKGPINLTVSKE